MRADSLESRDMNTIPPQRTFLKHIGRQQPRWKRQANYWLWRLAKREEDPEALARGIAVGMFAGVLPMLGQSFVAIALAWLFRGSRIVAAAMTFVSNPATTFPIFFLDYWVGCHLLGKPMLAIKQSDFESWDAFSALGLDFVVAIFLGGFVVGAIAGVISYFAGHAIVKRLKRKKRGGKSNDELSKSA